MSAYPNGQPYYPTHNQNNPYGTSHQGQSGLHRTSSFDAGDDARFFDQDQNQNQPRAGPGYTSYGGYSNVPGMNQSQPQHSGQQANIPYRSGTQNYNTLGGYQHQYQASPTGNATYNPAQYQPQPQSQYSPITYSNPQSNPPLGAYQPYVPAAYQDTSLIRQSSMYHNYYSAQPSGYSPQPPAPPPRPHEQNYGVSNSAYPAYQHEPQTNYSQGYGQPYGSPNPYTGANSPPAPPPPPHHDNSSAVRPYSHSHTSNYDQHGNSFQPGASTLSAYDSPDIHRNYSGASRMSNQSSSFAPSPQPSLPTPPSRNASHHSPQRSNTLDRHPQGRSLPGVPSESESDNDYFVPHRPFTRQPAGYDDLMSHLDAAISSTDPAPIERVSAQRSDPLFSSSQALSPDERPTHLNGVVTTGEHNINYGAFANDSDAEAAAGLAAMQAADEQEAAEEERRKSTQTLHHELSPQPSSRERSDDSDYAGYDLSLAGGGYAGTMSYGDEPFSQYTTTAATMPIADYGRLNPRMNSVRSTGMSSEGRTSQASGVESLDSGMLMFPIRTDVARVDTGGTGGLTEPSAHPRRLSYEDGDEVDMSQYMGGASPSRESIPDLFFHPGMNQQRPLPPPPSHSDPGSRLPHLIPAGSSLHQNRYSQYSESTSYLQPNAPDQYQRSPSPSSAVPRSTSLASSRNVPKPEQPMRSKTDADRAKMQRQQLGTRSFNDIFEVTTPQSAVALDLPAIPRKKFNPSKISAEQFRRCTEPWALGSVVAWIRELAEEETDLKEHAIAEGIAALFTNKVPTMNTTEAELLGEKVVKQMLVSGALVQEEEWVKFGLGSLSGVLFQLTGTGCYSSRLHLHSTRGRCYSYHCMRTLKKVDLSLPDDHKSDDWATYYKLKKEDVEGHEGKEIQRQNVLHEIVTSEETYMGSLDVLRILYRDHLSNMQPPIIPVKKLPSFLRDVFGHVDKVKKVNEDFLLAQLKYRQREQGPFIAGFSDIFREWIRRARAVYADYAATYPQADYLVRREAERNILFKQFLDTRRDDPRSKKLSWDSFLKSPITRLQRYSLLLETVAKQMVKDSEEKSNTLFAIDEVRAATFECNAKVAEMEKKVELVELANKMKLRKSMDVVELNLDHLGRQVILRGDLQRAGGKGFQMVDTHAVLFDHYLVLAKRVVSRDSSGSRKQEQYDVSKTPIPMDLISLESTNDPPVVKSSLKGVAAVTTTVAPRGQTPQDPRLARTTSTASGATLTHTNTGLSQGSSTTAQSMVASTVLDGNTKDDKVLYPFRVKHLGKAEVYNMYASSADARDKWCDAIITAKEAHAEALYAQNAEPYKLRVLADTAFGFENYLTGSRRISIRGTPLHRAVQESERRYEGSGRPAPICRAPVNCATVFQQPYGRYMCAVGTDYGVYISEYSNPRGWVRAIQTNRVTQISVLEEFNLFLLIADKALIAYHLDVVCPPSGPPVPQADASMRKAPQRLSGSKDIGFFVSGKMKDRALVFYKKRDGTNSIFKVIEPVLQKSATTRSRFLPTSSRRGQTDFFRDYDEFYIPADCYSMNLFNTTLAISTQRGVEVMTLDKKQPWSVPNLRSESAETQAHLTSISSRIKDLRPLGMFRLSETEFLVAFEECAVYVNKHGDISRGVVMEFVGRAKHACLHEQYLLLCDEDFVEIRDAQNGRLKQVIAGRDMRLLDDGGNLMPGSSRKGVGLGGGLNGLGMQGIGNTPRTVKLCMQHPEYDKSYVIVELIASDDRP